MLPASSRSGDGAPFADTEFSKAKGVRHYSRPSTPRSLESRAVATICDYCSTRSRSVVVPNSGSSKEECTDFNESSTSSVSNFWIHSQHERNRIELTPSTGGLKVVLHGDIRELTNPKPSPEGARVEVRIHDQPASNQDHSEDQSENAHKPLEGVCIINECLRIWLTSERLSKLLTGTHCWYPRLLTPCRIQASHRPLTARSGHMVGRICTAPARRAQGSGFFQVMRCQ